jgi:LDH2 family malate/lactate/ureidoglycolate dehydrogenase
VKVDARRVEALAAAVLHLVGVAEPDAVLTAKALVAADLDGVPSHGVGLLPLYAQRIRAGSVSPVAAPTVVEDRGGLMVMDAGHCLGQVSAQTAVDLAAARAREYGIAIVAVRHAFHFGAASYWASQLARQGMVGMAFSNTRPLMPAPGGAQRVVGNNPLALAFPARPQQPVVVDMATSASAMGRIRIAAKQGKSIPDGWATDAEGRPTTSPEAAIAGMLLPAAGPKGFGLAVAVELLCAALASGAVGPAVRPLYDRLDEHYDCSHAFIAIDAGSLDLGRGIDGAVAHFAAFIRDSQHAPGIDRIYAPGDLERSRREANAGKCPLSPEAVAELNQLAQELRVAPLELID